MSQKEACARTAADASLRGGAGVGPETIESRWPRFVVGYKPWPAMVVELAPLGFTVAPRFGSREPNFPNPTREGDLKYAAS
jgi:hypothetical protein